MATVYPPQLGHEPIEVDMLDLSIDPDELARFLVGWGRPAEYVRAILDAVMLSPGDKAEVMEVLSDFISSN